MEIQRVTKGNKTGITNHQNWAREWNWTTNMSGSQLTSI